MKYIFYYMYLPGCPLSFETGGTMGYNCCFFLNFVPLHIESPYNFGGKKPSAESKWACWSKWIFKYIFNHILWHKYIHKLQSGFLPGYSTSHQLVVIYHCIMTAFENQTPLSLTLCDVSKAFDHVWIRGLIYKLEKYGMRGYILEWLKTYLTERKQKVVLNNTKSEIGCYTLVSLRGQF